MDHIPRILLASALVCAAACEPKLSFAPDRGGSCIGHCCGVAIDLAPDGLGCGSVIGPDLIWSPDGREIYYTDLGSIRAFRPATRSVRTVLYPFGGALRFRLSANGRHVYFVTLDGSADAFRLYRVTAGGDSVTRLIPIQSYGFAHEIAFEVSADEHFVSDGVAVYDLRSGVASPLVRRGPPGTFSPTEDAIVDAPAGVVTRDSVALQITTLATMTTRTVWKSVTVRNSRLEVVAVRWHDGALEVIYSAARSDSVPHTSEIHFLNVSTGVDRTAGTVVDLGDVSGFHAHGWSPDGARVAIWTTETQYFCGWYSCGPAVTALNVLRTDDAPPMVFRETFRPGAPRVPIVFSPDSKTLAVGLDKLVLRPVP